MGSEKYLDSFFDYDKYHIDDFINGKKYYICGDKGTGKTALLKYLEVVFNSKRENLVLPIRFKTDIDELDRKTLRTGGNRNIQNYTDIENIKPSDTYKDVWMVFLINKILEAEKNGEFKVFLDTKEYITLRKIIESMYSGEDSNIVPRMKRGKIKIDLNIFDKVKTELSSDLEFDEKNLQIDFRKTAKSVMELYKRLQWDRTPVYVLVDELELSVKNNKARKQDIELVRDLLISINYLNEISKQHGYQIHFIASVREEVINDVAIVGNEINKCVEDFGISVDWSYKGGSYIDSPLLKIIEKKIHASEKAMGMEDSDDVWKEYFTTYVNGEECRKYILSYSWQKPRDIIRMLRLTQEQANPDDTVFTQEMFDRALQKYSERAWNEICEELILNYHQNELDIIKSLFTGIAIPFTFDDLRKRIDFLDDIRPDIKDSFLNDTKKLIDFMKIMYKWGIVGNTGERMMFSFLGYRDLDLTGKMVIHKPLRNFFGVTGNR